MLRSQRWLIVALICSLLLHASPFAVDLLQRKNPEKTPASPPIQAVLRSPETLRETPPLTLAAPEKAKPQPVRREENAGKKAVDRKIATPSWTQSVVRQFAAQQREGLFYPEAAIRQGLEGEPLVLLVLDETGSVIAARIEQSSGHAILDQAALRAVRALRSIPADAPREVLLPVRFRLR